MNAGVRRSADDFYFPTLRPNGAYSQFGRAFAVHVEAHRHIAQVGRIPQVLIAYRDGMLPVYFLDELIGFARERRLWRSHLPAIIITNGRHSIGLVVDALHRREELFLRDLHPKLAKFPAISGVSVMGNGQIMLLLDGDALIQIAQRGGSRDRILAEGVS